MFMDWGTDEGRDLNPFRHVSIRHLLHRCIGLIFTLKVRGWVNKKFDSIWTVNAQSKDLRFQRSQEPH